MGKLKEEVIKQKLYNKHGDTIYLITPHIESKKSLFGCNICNWKWIANTSSVTAGGNKCPNCNLIRARKQYSYTYEYVKEYIESENYTLHSIEYINNKRKLEIACLKRFINYFIRPMVTKTILQNSGMSL